MKKVYFNDTYKQTESVIAGSKTMFHMFIPDGNYTARHWNTRLYRNPHAYYKDSRGMCQIINNDTGKLLIPKYQIGEIVAVAQSYTCILDYLPEPYRRKSDGLIDISIFESAGLKNKMFVKADLMPHQIKITNICIKSLQGISDEDCLREGVIKREEGHGYIVNGIDRFTPHGNAIAQQVAYYYEPIVFDSPREAFADLIDKLNGEGTWNLNPLTIFFEFELIK